ncbi:MAG: cytochrome c [Nitrospinota bacterium]
MIKRPSILIKTISSLILIYIGLKFIKPPLPFSLLFMYMALSLLGVLVWVTLYEETMKEFFNPIVKFLAGEGLTGLKKNLRIAILIIFPLWVGFFTYSKIAPKDQPPLEARVIHPAPPIEYSGIDNPVENNDENVSEGATVYYANCIFCHGDQLDGKGVEAPALNPPPANFRDIGTIAQLQESYLFWRILKGAEGLPIESTPWKSAMPPWEGRLTEDEIWKVIKFLYKETGHSPRTWE